VIRPNLFDPAINETMRARVRALSPDHQPAWGKMNVAQMCAHCAEVQEVYNGKPLLGSPWYVRLVGPLVARLVFSERPYPKNSATHPQFLMADEREFERERNRLLAALQAMVDAGPHEMDHPIFGQTSAEKVGWGTYKHLNHHLDQFGV
jgi:hypothetical protein